MSLPNQITRSLRADGLGNSKTSVILGNSAQWIQIDTLIGGDLLEIYTASSAYFIAITGFQRGLLAGSNPEVPSGEILLLGSWNEEGAPHWGTIRKGAGLLFSKINEVGSATKTSVVEALFLRKHSGAQSYPQNKTLSASQSSPARPPSPVPSLGLVTKNLGVTSNPRVRAVAGPKVAPRITPRIPLASNTPSYNAGSKL